MWYGISVALVVVGKPNKTLIQPRSPKGTLRRGEKHRTQRALDSLGGLVPAFLELKTEKGAHNQKRGKFSPTQSEVDVEATGPGAWRGQGRKEEPGFFENVPSGKTKKQNYPGKTRETENSRLWLDERKMREEADHKAGSGLLPLENGEEVNSLDRETKKKTWKNGLESGPPPRGVKFRRRENKL